MDEATVRRIASKEAGEFLFQHTQDLAFTQNRVDELSQRVRDLEQSVDGMARALREDIAPMLNNLAGVVLKMQKDLKLDTSSQG